GVIGSVRTHASRRTLVLRRSLAGLLAGVALLTACGGLPGGAPASALGDNAITIGSFDFPESELLAELYAQALERAGTRVIRAFDVGPRERVVPALQRGLLEVVPEYEGSMLGFLGGTASRDAAATHEALIAALASRGLTALDAAPAEDRNVFVMMAATAERL